MVATMHKGQRQSAVYLFVYGTLKRGYDHGDARRLHRNTTWIGRAHLRARLVLHRGYPAAILSCSEQHQVFGELYRLATPRLFQFLDRYEECGPNQPKPQPYARVVVPVRCESGDVIPASVYICTQPTDRLRVLKNGQFRRRDGWACHS